MTEDFDSSVDGVAKSLLEGITSQEEAPSGDNQEVDDTPAENETAPAGLDDGTDLDAAQDDVSDDLDLDGAEAIQDEPQDEEELFTVTINGVDNQVTRQELENGYSRNADYTRKTQNLSEERRKVEAQMVDVEQGREKYIVGLEQVHSALENLNATANPSDLLAKLESGEIDASQYTLAKEKMVQSNQQQEVIANELRKERVVERDRVLNSELALLRAARPDLVTPEKGKEVQDFITRPISEGGMGFKDLSAADNHQFLIVAADAMEFRKAKQTIEKPKPAKPMKPGAKNKPASATADKQQKLNAQAKKTGNVKDIARSLAGY